jgi:hypothetical protein
VTLDGEVMRTHEQIDAHFTPAFGPEYDFNAFMGRLETLRPRHLSDAERSERALARQAAHDELARKEAEIAEVEQRIGYREIEARKEAAYNAVWDAEYDVMETKPATTAGAVALLRFTAGLMEGLFSGETNTSATSGPYATPLISSKGAPWHEHEARNTEDTQSVSRASHRPSQGRASGHRRPFWTD